MGENAKSHSNEKMYWCIDVLMIPPILTGYYQKEEEIDIVSQSCKLPLAMSVTHHFVKLEKGETFHLVTIWLTKRAGKTIWYRDTVCMYTRYMGMNPMHYLFYLLSFCLLSACIVMFPHSNEITSCLLRHCRSRTYASMHILHINIGFGCHADVYSRHFKTANMDTINLL